MRHAICDMRHAICDMRYANTLYGSRECDMRISYGPRDAICEHATGRANTIFDTRIGYAL